MKTSPFQFADPVLIRLEFNIAQEENSETKNSNNVLVEVKKLENKTEAIVELEMSIKHEKFSLIARIGSVFKWTDEFDENKLDSLLNMNAPALLVSYLRPIIANVTGASPCGVFHVPFLNFTRE